MNATEWLDFLRDRHGSLQADRVEWLLAHNLDCSYLDRTVDAPTYPEWVSATLEKIRERRRWLGLMFVPEHLDRERFTGTREEIFNSRPWRGETRGRAMELILIARDIWRVDPPTEYDEIQGCINATGRHLFDVGRAYTDWLDGSLGDAGTDPWELTLLSMAAVVRGINRTKREMQASQGPHSVMDEARGD